MIQHCAMHQWVRRWRSRTAGVGWTGVALVTALTAGNCASQLGRKTVPKPSPSGATTAMHPEEMREVRSCAELQQLDRPAIKGGNCIGLPGGGFVGLVAGSRTSKWLDAEGLGRSEYSDYQVWLYRPPVDRPGVSPASGTNEPPAALSWPDEVVCRNGEERGGGNWDSERCALVLAHDLDGDGRLDVLIERRSTSSSGGCCSTESKTTSYTFYSVENGALVERVLIEDGRATGVVFMQGGKRRTIRARKAVILAGGVFGTAQLLLLSGIGPADHLREHGIPVVIDRPAVGENLQDHIDYVAGFETGGTVFTGTNLRTIFRTAGALWEWIRKRTGPMTTNYAEAGGFAKSSPDVTVPDLQFHFVPAILEDHGREKVKEAGFSGHVCVLRPESRGTVRLASADPAAAPLIDPGFLTDSRDMEIMKKGVRMLHRILTSPPLSRHGGKDRHATPLDDDAALEQMIRNRADTVYHPVGTARMGSDDAAVCDPRLRVRGVTGLYVADASIMPRLVSGNTNAPSIMIGERCADFVKADLAA